MKEKFICSVEKEMKLNFRECSRTFLFNDTFQTSYSKGIAIPNQKENIFVVESFRSIFFQSDLVSITSNNYRIVHPKLIRTINILSHYFFSQIHEISFYCK